MRTHLILPDPHSHPDFSNVRAEWFGHLVNDVKPDVVVCIGDLWDMPSLSGYDKGKRSFEGRRYIKDIEAGLDFNDRCWSIVRSTKKRLPLRIFCEGNHEERIKRAINSQPELEGAIGTKDLRLPEFYDVVVEYEGNSPGTYSLDGVSYAHYHLTGISGRPISGEHIGYTLVTKRLGTSVVGHNHLLDYCQRTDNQGKRVIGLSVGSYLDYKAPWAGMANDLWWSGVCVLRNVDNGQFDLQTISLEAIRNEYGRP